MNAFTIALFVFVLQSVITLVAVAEFPLSCDVSGNCVPFTYDIITSTTWSAIIQDQIDEGLYSTTKVQTSIFDQDIFANVGIILGMMGQVLFGSIAGIASIIVFFFGGSAISLAIAAVMQGIVYYFYAVLIVKGIRNVSGGLQS